MARFVTILPSTNIFAGRRAAHYVYLDGNEGYIHCTRQVVDKDFVMPETWNCEAALSERVFFGRWRLLEIYEIHTAETWATVGEIVVEMEKRRRNLMFEQNETEL